MKYFKYIRKILIILGAMMAIASQTHECAPQPHHILNSKIIKT